MADKSKYLAELARRRRVIDDLRARLQAHVVTRDREPSFEDRHLSTILGSHRHDIRAALGASLAMLELFGDLVEDYGTKGPKGDTGKGEKGDKGDQGDPGVCECECDPACEFLFMGS
ncbi:MAG: hypothetical protein FJ296_00725 [Planctomycetes bacterium]|nr:hypothetical protein [Planctomycetota bacterium]